MMGSGRNVVTAAAVIVVALGMAANVGCQKKAARVAVTVTEEGFSPSEIPAKAGQPITLVVTRKTETTCATEIVFADLGVEKELPLDRPVEVTITPKKPGDLRFACGMDMVSGKLVVE